MDITKKGFVVASFTTVDGEARVVKDVGGFIEQQWTAEEQVKMLARQYGPVFSVFRATLTTHEAVPLTKI